MTKNLKLRAATGLLLASAALPPTALFAQDAQPAETAQPIVATPPAAVEPAPTVAAPTESRIQASEPVINTRASGREPVSPDAAETGSAARPVARPRTTRAPAPVRARVAAAPPAPTSVAPAPIAEAASAASPPPAALPPAPIAETLPVAPEPAAEPAPPPAETAQQDPAMWPWLLAAALAAAGLLLFARRRRRRAETDIIHHEEPVAAAPVAPPLAAAMPVAQESGRPWLDLQIRPVRAGVGADAARVEFELGIENNGTAHASDVRISTWLLPAGAAPTEMERMLIERPASAERRETELAPGEAAVLETAVALPTVGLDDAILPVVVADARYRLPDGSEGRTAASFAVGVPDGEELVMFDVENPSGMHDGVEARLHGRPRRD